MGHDERCAGGVKRVCMAVCKVIGPSMKITGRGLNTRACYGVLVESSTPDVPYLDEEGIARYIPYLTSKDCVWILTHFGWSRSGGVTMGEFVYDQIDGLFCSDHPVDLRVDKADYQRFIAGEVQMYSLTEADEAALLSECDAIINDAGGCVQCGGSGCRSCGEPKYSGCPECGGAGCRGCGRQKYSGCPECGGHGTISGCHLCKQHASSATRSFVSAWQSVLDYAKDIRVLELGTSEDRRTTRALWTRLQERVPECGNEREQRAMAVYFGHAANVARGDLGSKDSLHAAGNVLARLCCGYHPDHPDMLHSNFETLLDQMSKLESAFAGAVYDGNIGTQQNRARVLSLAKDVARTMENVREHPNKTQSHYVWIPREGARIVLSTNGDINDDHPWTSPKTSGNIAKTSVHRMAKTMKNITLGQGVRTPSEQRQMLHDLRPHMHAFLDVVAHAAVKPFAYKDLEQGVLAKVQRSIRKLYSKGEARDCRLYSGDRAESRIPVAPPLDLNTATKRVSEHMQESSAGDLSDAFERQSSLNMLERAVQKRRPGVAGDDDDDEWSDDDAAQHSASEKVEEVIEDIRESAVDDMEEAAIDRDRAKAVLTDMLQGRIGADVGAAREELRETEERVAAAVDTTESALNAEDVAERVVLKEEQKRDELLREDESASARQARVEGDRKETRDLRQEQSERRQDIARSMERLDVEDGGPVSEQEARAIESKSTTPHKATDDPGPVIGQPRDFYWHSTASENGAHQLLTDFYQSLGVDTHHRFVELLKYVLYVAFRVPEIGARGWYVPTYAYKHRGEWFLEDREQWYKRSGTATGRLRFYGYQTAFLSHTDTAEEKRRKLMDAYGLFESLIEAGIKTNGIEGAWEYFVRHQHSSDSGTVDRWAKRETMAKFANLLYVFVGSATVTESLDMDMRHLRTGAPACTNAQVSQRFKDDLTKCWTPEMQRYTAHELLSCRRHIRIAHLRNFVSRNSMNAFINMRAKHKPTDPVTFGLTEESELCAQFFCGLCDLIEERVCSAGKLPSPDNACWDEWSYDPHTTWRKFHHFFDDMCRRQCPDRSVDYWIYTRRLLFLMNSDSYNTAQLQCLARLFHDTFYHVVMQPIKKVACVAKRATQRVARSAKRVLRETKSAVCISSSDEEIPVTMDNAADMRTSSSEDTPTAHRGFSCVYASSSDDAPEQPYDLFGFTDSSDEDILFGSSVVAHADFSSSKPRRATRRHGKRPLYRDPDSSTSTDEEPEWWDDDEYPPEVDDPPEHHTLAQHGPFNTAATAEHFLSCVREHCPEAENSPEHQLLLVSDAAFHAKTPLGKEYTAASRAEQAHFIRSHIINLNKAHAGFINLNKEAVPCMAAARVRVTHNPMGSRHPILINRPLVDIKTPAPKRHYARLHLGV